jgi:transcriptional regulator with XRE-family HTH domain
MQRAKPSNPFGEFLRARRDRLRPEDFGLPPGQRRRAPGLRREEAAQLCGISPTWFTWIEQGRTSAVSVATLAAIARGLRLSRAERRYLFELAARADPAPPRDTDADPDALRDLVNAVRTPAYVLDRHWEAIAWNRAAALLLPGWLGSEASSRNLLQYVFLDRGARRVILGWADRAERLVAEFRAETAAWRDDPVRQALVHDLQDASPDFASAWRSQAVLGRDGGQRRFSHATRGRLTFEQHSLAITRHAELRLVILVSR